MSIAMAIQNQLQKMYDKCKCKHVCMAMTAEHGHPLIPHGTITSRKISKP